MILKTSKECVITSTLIKPKAIRFNAHVRGIKMQCSCLPKLDLFSNQNKLPIREMKITKVRLGSMIYLH